MYNKYIDKYALVFITFSYVSKVCVHFFLEATMSCIVQYTFTAVYTLTKTRRLTSRPFSISLTGPSCIANQFIPRVTTVASSTIEGGIIDGYKSIW